MAGEEKKCVSCAAWLAPPPGSPDAMMGQCRRHPPTPFLVQMQVGKVLGPGQKPQVVPQIISAWPPVPATGGCWEWIPEVKPSDVEA